MHARHRQGGDVHGHTTVQVQGADEEEEPPKHYRPAGGNESLVCFHFFIAGYNVVGLLPNRSRV